LDVSSFESDVLDILGKIREITAEMPIITVTAFGGQVSEEDFANLKIQKHFTKPLNVIELQWIVDELMADKTKEENADNQNEISGNASKVDNLIDGITNQMENKESLV
jgi:response regulator RpfG family c-di-GMP phosphodiesterase